MPDIGGVVEVKAEIEDLGAERLAEFGSDTLCYQIKTHCSLCT